MGWEPGEVSHSNARSGAVRQGVGIVDMSSNAVQTFSIPAETCSIPVQTSAIRIASAPTKGEKALERYCVAIDCCSFGFESHRVLFNVASRKTEGTSRLVRLVWSRVRVL